MTHQKAEGRLTHPSDTAGAVEKNLIGDLMEMFADPDVNRLTFRAASEIARLETALESALSLNATLQGRVDLAVGALERAIDQLFHLARDPRSNALIASLRGIVSKIKEGEDDG